MLMKMAVLAVIALGVQCCAGIDDVENPISANLRITLSVPATKAPMGDENPPFVYDDVNQHEGSDNVLMLSDLDFYFFNPDGSYATHASGFSSVALSPVSYISVGQIHQYTADIKVDGVVNNRDYRVVVVANRMQSQSGVTSFCVPLTPSPLAPAGYPGTDEQYLYSQLAFDTCSDGAVNNRLAEYTSRNLSGSDYARVPMWGVQEMNLKVSLTDDSSLISSGEINLLRSIAKVKVSIDEDLLQYVKVTDYVPGDSNTGAVMHFTRDHGLMTPSYANASAAGTTWNSAGQDKSAGVYVDVNVNTTDDTGTFTAPMYKDTDGSYYMYIPEQKIGEAWMTLQFEYLDINLVDPLKVEKKLLFANYEDAATALLGGKDIPLTEDQLEPYRFPVMRNHYYIYTVTKLDPFELKFEVCEWQHKSTSIIFK